MPDLQEMSRSLRESEAFANMDMCHAYWQILLAAGSRKFMSIQTPIGAYMPTRILQGLTDAGNHFQAVSLPAFEKLEFTCSND